MEFVDYFAGLIPDGRVRLLVIQHIEGLLAAQETAFKERVREVVPPERENYPGMEEYDFTVRIGWNDCRQEVLTRIERLSQ